MKRILQVITTCDDAERAEALARVLIEERLAACVQIDGPIKSVYRWQGQIECSQEWRCSIKTKLEHLAKLTRRVKALHSYDVPQILVNELSVADEAYAEWLEREVKP